MPRTLQLRGLLKEVSPAPMCYECIRDRVPLNSRGELRGQLSELASPFHHSTGECSSCGQLKEVTHHNDQS